MGMDAQKLIDAGTHQLCSCGRTLIRAGADMCRDCRQHGTQEQPAPVMMPSAGGQGSIDAAALGGLSTLPDHTLWLVVHGKPVTQGSMKAVAAGVVIHAKSKALHAWRDAITVEALRACGTDWATVTCPIQLDVVFTLPKPQRLTNRFGVTGGPGDPVPAAAKPDVDKLLRAVQDALSPRESGGRQRFKLVEDDSRIIGGSQYKTYPAPHHTHPWALDRPGAVIRVTPVGVPHPTPSAALTVDGELPEQAVQLHQQADMRRRW